MATIRSAKEIYKDIRRDEEEEEWKVAGIQIAKDIFNTKLGKDIHKFNQNKDVLDSTIHFKTAVDNGGRIVNEYNTAYNHEGGAVNYYVEKFTPMLKQQIEMDETEATFDPDVYNRLVHDEALRLAKEQKGHLDNAYKHALALGSDDPLKAKADYEKYKRINDGYEETLGGALGAKIRRVFSGETRESITQKGLDAIKNSTYKDNADAFNRVLKTFNEGYTISEAMAIETLAKDKELNLLRQGDTITSRTENPEEVRDFADGSSIILRTQTITGIDKNGAEFNRTVGIDEVSKKWLRDGQRNTRIEHTTKDHWGVETTSMHNLVVDRVGNVIGPPTALPLTNNNVISNGNVNSTLLSHMSDVLSMPDGPREAYFNSIKGSIRNSIEGTNLELDPEQTLKDIEYENILMANGYNIDPVMFEAKSVEEAQNTMYGRIGGLAKQINVEYFDDSPNALKTSIDLATQIFINSTNKTLVGGGGWFGGDYVYDLSKGSLDIHNLNTIYLLQAIGSREGKEGLGITRWKDVWKNIYTGGKNKRHILKEFQTLSEENRSYFLRQFEDTEKYSFLHRGKDRTLFKDLVEADRRAGGRYGS